MEQRLDLRWLPPPEPLERLLDALTDLPLGDWLRVTLEQEPLPLYGMLKNLGYDWSTAHREEGPVDVLIWPADQAAPPIDPSD
jgi:uncharacterized protein (DUF2249 family)